MKTFLAVTAGVLALAVGPASAADLGVPARGPMPAPAYNWTGFYLGGNVGYGNGEDSVSTSSTLGGAPFGSPFSFETKSNGFFGGGQAGFNYEFPTNFVIGVEADGDGSGISGSSSTCPGTFQVPNCSLHNIRLEDFGTVRGRFGYAWNNVLVYGTGGWAWGDGQATATLSPKFSPSGFANSSATVSPSISGWVVGAGVEVGLLSFPGWTVRLEYLHLEFDNIGNTLNFGTVPVLGALVSTSTANNRFDTLRFGVNYLFSWGAPPIATRY
jgi:outer membrane immunogenic protein